LLWQRRTNVWREVTSPALGLPATNKRPAARRNSSGAANRRGPRCGVSALLVFHCPLAARVERKLKMNCIYSSACVYGLTALTVAIWLIPLLFVIWRWVKAPIRTRDLVFLGLLGLIFLIQGVSELIGPNAMTALIYILAGVR
jgi:hypothetical protein